MSEPVEETSLTPPEEATRPEPPVQEQILRAWDGVRFEDEPVPEPSPEPHPVAEDQGVDYLIFSLITSHNTEPLETSLRCPQCERSNLIYCIHQWDNSKLYKGRQYAFTEMFCAKCGYARRHSLCGRNDIEYHYLGIKDD